MLKHRQLTESRIDMMLPRIQALVNTNRASLDIEAFAVGGEPITWDEASRREFAPFSAGDKWGANWDTSWFHFSGTIPADWKGLEVIAQINLGFLAHEGFTAEGLVWQDGKPVRAINTFRHDVPLALCAKGGEAFSFYVEAAANPKSSDIEDQSGGDVKAGLSVSGVNGAPGFVLRRADLTTVNRDALGLYLDVYVANATMKSLPDDSPRRGQLLSAINESLNLFDEFDISTIALARKALAPAMGAKNGDSQHNLSAIGHSHIDTAWLWPLRETLRKCARTFSTMLAYMDEYPEFIFCCSQAQQYAWIKEHYPSIYEDIKGAIKAGQWEPVGSMWVEVDCNIPSGESLVRQILLGKNYFMDEFGVDTTDCWIPDVFGYSAALPQILKKSGIKYFLTQKISSNQFNKFPHHTFLWEGIDGTQMFSHFPPADTYNSDFNPGQLIYNVRNFREHDRANRSLYVFGYGDGGGGPTKQMLEVARRTKDMEGLPKVTIEKVSDFFPKAQEDAKDLPVWAGELYYERHRGTYTTHAKNKRNNRKCEFLLREAEMLDSVVRVLLPGQAQISDKGAEALPYAVYDVTGCGIEHPDSTQDLDRAWKLLLLNQFHDIIPGSSIHWVYEDSDVDYATIKALAGRVIERRMSALAGAIDTQGVANPLIVLNSTSEDRDEVISLASGEPTRVAVPKMGYKVIDAAKSTEPAIAPVTVAKAGSEITLDNGIVRIVIDAQGVLSSIFDHRAKREVLLPGERGNVLHLHKDYPVHSDAWDIDAYAFETTQDLTDVDEVSVVENHPLRATVQVLRKFGNSKLAQRIVLRSGSARIDFETQVDWHEDHKLLKASFPVNILSRSATFEIQYGHTERPTHQNTTWDMARFEVCAQKWADVSEGDYGVALLNDCKYGYDIRGSVMRLSLLRATTAPDPIADRGEHEFTYSLLPHTGDVRLGGVVAEAYALNIPLTSIPVTAHSGQLPSAASFFEADRPGVVFEAVKKAEKGDAIIVRFYEAFGTRGPVTISTSLPFAKAAIADLMEQDVQPVEIVDGKIKIEIAPFEIVTLKLT